MASVTQSDTIVATSEEIFEDTVSPTENKETTAKDFDWTSQTTDALTMEIDVQSRNTVSSSSVALPKFSTKEKLYSTFAISFPTSTVTPVTTTSNENDAPKTTMPGSLGKSRAETILATLFYNCYNCCNIYINTGKIIYYKE